MGVLSLYVSIITYEISGAENKIDIEQSCVERLEAGKKEVDFFKMTSLRVQYWLIHVLLRHVLFLAILSCC